MRGLALALALCWPGLAAASICESLARQAETRHGLPPGLLVAIARTESGRNGEAWPWTLNIAGDGQFFASRDAALDRARREIASGRRNMDLGCMQVNYHWHGAEFTGPEAMLDPETNVAYAARHLAALYAQTGDWDLATQRYHSADPARGAGYLSRVNQNRDSAPAPDARPAGNDLAALMARLGPSAPPRWTPATRAPRPQRPLAPQARLDHLRRVLAEQP